VRHRGIVVTATALFSEDPGHECQPPDQLNYLNILFHTVSPVTKLNTAVKELSLLSVSLNCHTTVHDLCLNKAS